MIYPGAQLGCMPPISGVPSWGCRSPGLPDAAGIGVRQLRRYEAGEQQPILSAAVALANPLGISVAELAGNTADRLAPAGDWWASWQPSMSRCRGAGRHNPRSPDTDVPSLLLNRGGITIPAA
ncbi:helix-turn-helix domain-containing protein [Actinopolyspora sp. H202]|uniref:helix-turn-helix domain-containing protein n=1 Tax=Actinopolyspora sp. H202 TaxID=1500456 RepID=UPI003EE4B800